MNLTDKVLNMGNMNPYNWSPFSQFNAPSNSILYF